MNLLLPIFHRLANVFAFQNHLAAKDYTVINYTMGTVGSSTLFYTLKTKLLFSRVFHAHFLSEPGLKLRMNRPQHVRNIRKAEIIQNYVKKHPAKRRKFISLVREPVSRNISDVFQNPQNYIKDKQITELAVDELMAEFDRKDYRYTLD